MTLSKTASSVIMVNVVISNVIKLSVAFFYCYAQCHNPDCQYAECRYAECHYADCHCAECHYWWMSLF
jgi:hypothetical protein